MDITPALNSISVMTAHPAILGASLTAIVVCSVVMLALAGDQSRPVRMLQEHWTTWILALVIALAVAGFGLEHRLFGGL